MRLYLDDVVEKCRQSSSQLLAHCFVAFLLLTVMALPAAAQATSPLQLNLFNDNPDYTSSQVYYTFTTGPTLTGSFSASYTDATTGLLTDITMNSSGISNSVALSNIQSGVIDLYGVNSGVMYISLGTNAALDTSATPNPVGNPDFSTRWSAAVELTYEGNQGDSGDITAINSVAIPVNIQTLSSGNVVQQAGITTPTNTLYNEVAALATYTPIKWYHQYYAEWQSGPHKRQTQIQVPRSVRSSGRLGRGISGPPPR